MCDTFSASVCNGRLRFGAYPSDNDITNLMAEGYKSFVDLTDEHDAAILTGYNCVYPYKCPDGCEILRVPITDRTPGSQNDVNRILSWILEKIEYNHVYVHCRGGHGRSAVIAAIIIRILDKVSAMDALRLVKEAHQRRTMMKPQWRKLGAPQTKSQKDFVKSWIV